MQFIATESGYLNMMYVRRLYVDGTRIEVEDVFGATHLHDDFDTEDAAQDWLDDLIKEMEDEDRRGAGTN